MTVRWKPLLVLSGLFVVVALGGLVAFTLLRGPGGTKGILAKARAERQARRFAEAEVEYRRALQLDPRDASVHQELAAVYEEWLRSATGDKAAKLEVERRSRLADAAKFGPTLPAPRLALLRDALDRDDSVEALRWANEALKLDADEPTAHYVVAASLLDESSPNVAEVRRHLAIVAKAEPRPARAEWLAARVAQVAGDDAELKRVLVRSRGIGSVKGMASVDALAVFRLRTLDVQTIDEPAALGPRIKSVLAAAEELTAGETASVLRIGQLGSGDRNDPADTPTRPRPPEGSGRRQRPAPLGSRPGRGWLTRSSARRSPPRAGPTWASTSPMPTTSGSATTARAASR